MLPKFFIAENDELQKNAVYIISTRAPYPIGQVFRFTSGAELDHWKKLQDRPVAVIPGYFVAIIHVEYMEPETAGRIKWESEYLQENLQLMGRFFERTRINRGKPYWRKFAENKPA